jgi:dethiobiotin synthetase
LTMHFARSVGLRIKGIIINGSTQGLSERDNMETITKLAGVSVIITVPALIGVDTEKRQVGNLKEVFEKSIVIDEIMAMMDAV